MDLGCPKVFGVAGIDRWLIDRFALRRFQIDEVLCFPEIDAVTCRVRIEVITVFIKRKRVCPEGKQWIGKEAPEVWASALLPATQIKKVKILKTVHTVTFILLNHGKKRSASGPPHGDKRQFFYRCTGSYRALRQQSCKDHAGRWSSWVFAYPSPSTPPAHWPV